MPAFRSTTTSRPAAHDSVRLALLRGVNVGSKMVAMADLRRVAEGLGFTQVSTLINSGNLVYRSTRTTPQQDAVALHAAIATTLQVRSTIFVRPLAQVAALLDACPLPVEAALAPSRLLVTLWDEHADDEALDRLVQAAAGDERFVRVPGAVYHWLPHGISASKTYETATRRLGEHITARNWSTMNKLLKRMHTLPPDASAHAT